MRPRHRDTDDLLYAAPVLTALYRSNAILITYLTYLSLQCENINIKKKLVKMKDVIETNILT